MEANLKTVASTLGGVGVGAGSWGRVWPGDIIESYHVMSPGYSRGSCGPVATGHTASVGGPSRMGDQETAMLLIKEM